MTSDLDALKARHRAMWALGDYPAVASEIIGELGPVLVTAAGVSAGQHVLDVAAGSGNASLPAARLGADVGAPDLCPDLLRVGENLAVEEGLALKWRECDAEDMPCSTGEYDVTFSCVGVMF